MDGLRQSLAASIAAWRVAEREGAGSRSSAAALAWSHGRDQCHQAAGALEMVGQEACARLVRGMESLALRWMEDASTCTPAAIDTLESAGFALIELLDGRLAGRSLSPVALFPQYREVLTLAGAARIHPADLWTSAWSWRPVDGLPPKQPLEVGPAVRARLEAALLRLMQTGESQAARALSELFLGLAWGTTAAPLRSLWALASGMFEATALGLLPWDHYTKRTASRLLLECVAQMQGLAPVSEQAGRELAFFCAMARRAKESSLLPATPVLLAVRQAWSLEAVDPVDYEARRFGRCDPVLLAQVRKGLGEARDGWSQLAGGDISRLRSVAEQFSQWHEALVRLHAPLGFLAARLVDVVQERLALGEAPSPDLALEGATILLFLEGWCQDFDPDREGLPERIEQLAQRLDRVRQGQPAFPLEPWMEELYRGVNHRQTLGSVVDELRGSLRELERELDGFFRAPQELGLLQGVPVRLSQMRGVLSVLGLDQAAQAVVCMREAVETLSLRRGEPSASVLEGLGNNLGALGFLVDMLSYQPALARTLFVFDAQAAQLRSVMGRVTATAPEALEPAVSIGPAAGQSPGQPAGQPAEEMTRVQAPEGLDPQEAGYELPAVEVVSGLEVIEAAPEALSLQHEAPADACAVEPQLSLASEFSPQVPPSPTATEPVSRAEPSDQDASSELMNVFLDEADAWSTDLQSGLDAWAGEPSRPLPEQLLVLAHSLAGSSATVGLHGLAELSRELESALASTHRGNPVSPTRAAAFQAAADEIRALLHQFAAGFSKDPDPSVLQALRDTGRVSESPSVPGPQVAAQADSASRQTQETPEHTAPLPPVQSPVPAFAQPLTRANSTIDADLFPIFEEEALQLLPRLAEALRSWHAMPGASSAREEALRVLHTLKGSARLAGATALGEMAHQLESRVESAAAEPESIASLLIAFDQLESVFEALRRPPGGDDDAAGPGGPPLARPPLPPMTGPGGMALSPSASTPDDRVADAIPTQLPTRAAPTASWPAPLPAPSTPVADIAGAGLAATATGLASIRVRAQLLDRLLSESGEVMVSRDRLETDMRQLRGSLQDLTGNLDRLRSQLRDVELQAEMQMQSRMAQTRDAAHGFDPLEFDRFTRMQELTRMMAESVNDIATVQRQLQHTVVNTQDDLAAQGRQARALQRDLLRTRMLPFETLADRLHRVVRLAARDTGRLAALSLAGAAIEIDRSVLERITPALEHLLRNAVAHGIEPQAERLAAGKPAEGQIRITLSQQANEVCLLIEDDGAGLDRARIESRSRELGLLAPQQSCSDEQALELIFTPGFSTASSVTEVAGRGIGMDVVRAEVRALGGRIEVMSRPGAGVRFTLVLPLTTAVTQLVRVRCGTVQVGVPTHLVRGVRRLGPREVQQAYNSGQLATEEGVTPFLWGGAVLQASACSTEASGRTVPVLLLRSASQQLALHVDEVLGHQEVVVKQIGPQLARLPGLVGMTVLASGAILPIYNPVALVSFYPEAIWALSADRAQPEVLEAQAWPPSAPAGAVGIEASHVREGHVPLVLVVDDSITVRRVTQRLLEREGWRVALAADGLQALERLAQETPDLVLSDIEMPRMDGFELARSLRDHPAWAQVPLVMISSRSADKHRERAQALGVTHFLGKPYAEDELLALARRCLVSPEVS